MSRSDSVLQHSIALSFNSPLFFYPFFAFILPGESVFQIILRYAAKITFVPTYFGSCSNWNLLKQKKSGISSHWLKLSFSTVFKVSGGTCN